jgi:hypothetical protein
VLEDVALATDFMLIELQKLTATSLFAGEVRLNGKKSADLVQGPLPKKPVSAMERMVGDTGIEPVTTPV